MKKTLLTALMLIASVSAALAQGFNVYRNDGSIVQYSLAADSIVFFEGEGDPNYQEPISQAVQDFVSKKNIDVKLEILTQLFTALNEYYDKDVINAILANYVTQSEMAERFISIYNAINEGDQALGNEIYDIAQRLALHETSLNTFERTLKNFDERIENNKNDIANLQGDVQDNTDAIADLTQALNDGLKGITDLLNDYAKKSDLNGLATEADLNSLSLTLEGMIGNIRTEVEILKSYDLLTKVLTLQGNQQVLETRIAYLENLLNTLIDKDPLERLNTIEQALTNIGVWKAQFLKDLQTAKESADNAKTLATANATRIATLETEVEAKDAQIKTLMQTVNDLQAHVAQIESQLNQ